MYCVSYLVCDNVYVFDSYKLTLPPDASTSDCLFTGSTPYDLSLVSTILPLTVSLLSLSLSPCCPASHCLLAVCSLARALADCSLSLPQVKTRVSICSVSMAVLAIMVLL